MESCLIISHFIHAQLHIMTHNLSAICIQRSKILLYSLVVVTKCSKSHTLKPSKPLSALWISTELLQ